MSDYQAVLLRGRRSNQVLNVCVLTFFTGVLRRRLQALSAKKSNEGVHVDESNIRTSTA